MRRRGFIAILGGAALFAALVEPSVAGAQQQGKVYRIGYIQTATPEEQEHLTRAFEERLRAIGYVQGQNLSIERRFAMGKQERLPQLAAELVRLDVDVIVTGSNPVIAAVKQATSTIPVVMATSRDPLGAGFIASLAKPGGNITGLSGDPSNELHSKRLQLLKEAVPRASRLALMWNPLWPGAQASKEIVANAARMVGMTLQVLEVRGRDEFGEAFEAMARGRAEALLVLPDPVMFTARAQIVPLAAKHRLPAVYHAREVVDIGGLMSYGVSLADQFSRAADYADKILKGAKPADLPVEQPTKFELVINLKTAKALGLAIPDSLLAHADEVIE